MRPEIDWMTLSAIVVVVGAVAAIGWKLIRSQVAREFVPLVSFNKLSASVSDLDTQIRNVETQIAALPTDGEFQQLSVRLGNVEAGVAGVQGSLNGVAANVRTLLDNALRKDRD